MADYMPPNDYESDTVRVIREQNNTDARMEEIDEMFNNIRNPKKLDSTNDTTPIAILVIGFFY